MSLTDTRRRRTSRAILLLALLLAGRASAEEAALDAAAQGKESPWSRGVSEESRRAAEALFREGNALLRESITLSAAARYREALGHWDHPNIHYNLALALMGLDQPLETRDHLVAALAYGPEPLQRERYEHAKNYLALLEQQLARLKVRCDVVGARVELDGGGLFDAPGEHERLVRAGRHTLVASKEGLVTNHVVQTLTGGQTASIDLQLKSLEEMTTYRRRWSSWVPWTVVGAGAVVALAGGVLQYGGLQAIDRVDQESRVRCPAGCASEPTDLASDRARGETLQKLAIGAYGLGGATVATGALLVFLNRAERYVHPYESAEPGEPPRAAFQVSPILDRDLRGVVATVRY